MQHRARFLAAFMDELSKLGQMPGPQDAASGGTESATPPTVGVVPGAVTKKPMMGRGIAPIGLANPQSGAMAGM